MVRRKADRKVFNGGKIVCVKNIVRMLSKAGNLPLHGMNTFVKMAISLSLGLSMIREVATPTALHPNPIAIVGACFPQV